MPLDYPYYIGLAYAMKRRLPTFGKSYCRYFCTIFGYANNKEFCIVKARDFLPVWDINLLLFRSYENWGSNSQ